eukprot:3937424-Amphidinium_carterae.1
MGSLASDEHDGQTTKHHSIQCCVNFLTLSRHKSSHSIGGGGVVGPSCGIGSSEPLAVEGGSAS